MWEKGKKGIGKTRRGDKSKKRKLNTFLYYDWTRHHQDRKKKARKEEALRSGDPKAGLGPGYRDGEDTL